MVQPSTGVGGAPASLGRLHPCDRLRVFHRSRQAPTRHRSTSRHQKALHRRRQSMSRRQKAPRLRRRLTSRARSCPAGAPGRCHAARSCPAGVARRRRAARTFPAGAPVDVASPPCPASELVPGEAPCDSLPACPVCPAPRTRLRASTQPRRSCVRAPAPHMLGEQILAVVTARSDICEEPHASPRSHPRFRARVDCISSHWASLAPTRPSAAAASMPERVGQWRPIASGGCGWDLGQRRSSRTLLPTHSAFERYRSLADILRTFRTQHATCAAAASAQPYRPLATFRWTFRRT